jgi:hypothetical protein
MLTSLAVALAFCVGGATLPVDAAPPGSAAFTTLSGATVSDGVRLATDRGPTRAEPVPVTGLRADAGSVASDVPVSPGTPSVSGPPVVPVDGSRPPAGISLRASGPRAPPVG